MAELTRIQAVVFLQSCDLFAFCKADEVLRIAGIVHERRFAEGQRIYERNGPADMLYGVVQGEVGVQDGVGTSARMRNPTDVSCNSARRLRCKAAQRL